MNKLFGLAIFCWMIPGALLAQDNQPAPRFPKASTREAWKWLPREEPPLPAWALTLVSTLPKTTAALLELDYLHRAKNPLGSALAAKLRYVAADAGQCAYARHYALADLRRAGVGEQPMRWLSRDFFDLPHAEGAALRFARKMTAAPHTVTDADVAELVHLHGPALVVAMVHTLAFANFHQRIVQALGVDVEAEGPLPPLEPHLDGRALKMVKSPARPPWPDQKEASAKPNGSDSPGWRDFSFDDLEKELTRAKARKPRLPLLSKEQLKHLPPPIQEHALKVFWSNLSLGHQPQLTSAWFACMSAFQQEAKLPKLFTASLFWVITRSNECFY